ncbi:MAG TPA: phosphatase PAP2 family protein [Polyangiaceae bacterium]|nr:phosphatase PAP2 family protein [Polyangiaceae bacterium]
MNAVRTRLFSHVRKLWPRHPLLAPAPFWFLVAFWLVQGKLRWDHLALALVATALAYGSAWSKRLYLGILPIGLVGVLYDSMRAVKNVGLTRDNVHVCDLRGIDQRFFGLELNGVRTTWHDYFQQHATLFWDVYCAIPYATFLGVMVVYAVYLFRRDYPALQRFTWSFLVMNVAGFITYHVYPAAPPWYYHQYGCAVDLATHASAGPNLARVDAWLGIPYFAGMYGRSSDVFGAVPSLHVAYPLLLLIDGFRRHRWLGRVLLAWFYLSMCFAAVYLDHHWVFDVVVGSLYAVVVSSLIRRLFSARWGTALPGMPAHGAAK